MYDMYVYSDFEFWLNEPFREKNANQIPFIIYKKPIDLIMVDYPITMIWKGTVGTVDLISYFHTTIHTDHGMNRTFVPGQSNRNKPRFSVTKSRKPRTWTSDKSPHHIQTTQPISKRFTC